MEDLKACLTHFSYSGFGSPVWTQTSKNTAIVFESLKRPCSGPALYVISVLSDNLSRPLLPARGSGLSQMNSRGHGLAAEQVYPADGNVSAEDVEVRAHEGALLKQCMVAE